MPARRKVSGSNRPPKGPGRPHARKHKKVKPKKEDTEEILPRKDKGEVVHENHPETVVDGIAADTNANPSNGVSTGVENEHVEEMCDKQVAEGNYEEGCIVHAEEAEKLHTDQQQNDGKKEDTAQTDPAASDVPPERRDQEQELNSAFQARDDTPLVLCKRCYCDYGRDRSPKCQHIFCRICYQKSLTNFGGFDCFLCAEKTGQDEVSTSDFTSRQKFKCNPECCILGKGVKKTMSFGFKQFKSPEKLAASTNGNYVIADSGVHKLLIFDNDGRFLKGFPHLYGYSFQGGLGVSQNDVIMMGLKNEKYNSVSFYHQDGQFKFSAFLENSSSVSALATNGIGEILALDEISNSVWVINEEKLVHTQVHLTPDAFTGRVSSFGACDLNGKERILTMDGHGVVCVFNYRGSLKSKMALTLPSMAQSGSAPGRFSAKETLSERIMQVDKQGCLLVADRTDRRIDLFCLKDGTHINCLVQFPTQIPIDITVSDTGKCAVLLEDFSTGAGNKVEEFTYSIPSKFRKPPARKPDKEAKELGENGNRTSKCCTIL